MVDYCLESHQKCGIEFIAKRKWIQDASIALILGTSLAALWSFNYQFLNAKKIVYEFIFPLSIAVFVLITGTIGFLELKYDFGDAFFAAGNFLTLNTSVFNNLAGDITPTLWIMAARIFGGVFLAYAFFLALILAVGSENYNRVKLRAYLIRTKIFGSRNLHVVIGSGQKAVFLALDLANEQNEHKKVVLLYEELGEALESMLENTNIWFMKGNPSSRIGLDKTHFQQANNVYVLNETDEKNFRTFQEMIEIAQAPHSTVIISKWYIHLTDPRHRALITPFAAILKNDITKHEIFIHPFDFCQNIARKVTHEHPIDRFETGANVAQVVVIGFNALAQAIAIQCLRLGHFRLDRYLQIKVFYTPDEQANVDKFMAAHPELFRTEQLFNSIIHKPDAERYKEVKEYTFFRKAHIVLRDVIRFEPLPEAESELVSPDFSLYQCVSAQNCTSIYVCLPSGLQSASLLNAILPCIEQKREEITQKTGDVKVFCHYDFPDKEEVVIIEQILNKITERKVPVVCFGNSQSICTSTEIENKNRDRLAKYIALLYKNVYGRDVDFTTDLLNEWQPNLWDEAALENNWKNEPEIYRESNRQAADHAWVKFREMKRELKNIPNDLAHYWSEEELPVLAEMEHRRWNAEKLLLGWLPLLTDPTKEQKKKRNEQKRHFFLMDFATLPEAEKTKDYTQVIGLPYFLKNVPDILPPPPQSKTS